MGSPMDRRRWSSYASVAAGSSVPRSRALEVFGYASAASYNSDSPTGRPGDAGPSGRQGETGLDGEEDQERAPSNSHTRAEDAGYSKAGDEITKTPSFWETGTPGPFFPDGRVMGSDAAGMAPSYLHGTRYMEKLEASRRAKVAAQREAAYDRASAFGQVGAYGQVGGGGAMALSTSSSSASLHKMAPSHRGMTYEIVESSPLGEEDAVPPLPSCWKERDKSGCVEVSSDGVELRCSSIMKTSEHEAAAARTDVPMPAQAGVYYFEVAIINKGKEG